jgi:WD40 repeat protein
MILRRFLEKNVCHAACVALLLAFFGRQPEVFAADSRTMTFTVVPASADSKRPAMECVVKCGPALTISALAFSPDENTLAVGGYREVSLWDWKHGKLAKRVGAGQLDGMIHAFAYSNDGKMLAVGDGLPCEKGAVKLLDISSGKIIAKLEGPHGMVNSVAINADGTLLAAGDDAEVHVWKLADRSLVKTLATDKGRVLGVVFSSDGKQLATGGANRVMQVWNTVTWEEMVRYATPAAVQSVAMSPDGKQVIVAVGGSLSSADEWAVHVGKIQEDMQDAAKRKPKTRALVSGSGMPLDVVWPVKGTSIYVAYHDQTVRAYDAKTARQLMTYSGHTDWVDCVASNATGSILASGSADGTVKLWTATVGKPIATLVQLAPGADAWIFMTSQGFFNVSDPAKLTWKGVAKIETHELLSKYHNSEAVSKALATAINPPPPPPKKDAKDPKKQASPSSGASAKSENKDNGKDQTKSDKDKNVSSSDAAEKKNKKDK